MYEHLWILRFLLVGPDLLQHDLQTIKEQIMTFYIKEDVNFLIRNRAIPTIYIFILPSARNPQNKPTNNPELHHLESNRLYRQYNFLAASKEGMLPDEFRTYYKKPDTFD